VLEENRLYHNFSLLREEVERKSKRREGLKMNLERELEEGQASRIGDWIGAKVKP
jgi:hypothetical protein